MADHGMTQRFAGRFPGQVDAQVVSIFVHQLIAHVFGRAFVICSHQPRKIHYRYLSFAIIKHKFLKKQMFSKQRNKRWLKL